MSALGSIRNAGPKLLFFIILIGSSLSAFGFDRISSQYWTEDAVRRILHTFTFGGHATDAQIARWAAMDPAQAVEQILSFAPVNEWLSPPEDATVDSAGSLEALQAFWSSDDLANRVCPDRRPAFAMTRTTNQGETLLANVGLQNTWVQAVKTRGANPFRQRVGLWLTNYHMAVSLVSVDAPLIRHLYDSVLNALAEGRPFHEILAVGATDAAIAYQYGHRNNVIEPGGSFAGNDDFARELHQLFFRIKGAYEDPDYHENVTIESTARALTGMQLDVSPFAYGATRPHDWWIAPIDFADHFDASGRYVANSSRHHRAAVEILRRPIEGATAQEKIERLAAVAIMEPESLDDLPVAIVSHFADDNLTPEKIADVRKSWKSVVGQPADLLMFLREYAISTAFHSEDTIKFRNAFDRNMTIYSLLTVDNDEAYGSPFTPLLSWLPDEGGVPFVPAHGVFGGQTSADAANSPGVFKRVYNRAVRDSEQVAVVGGYCGSESWEKDWGRIIPKVNGAYPVEATAAYLWQRFVADGHANYGVLERAHLMSLLATGKDLGYMVDRRNPDGVISESDLQQGWIADAVERLAAMHLTLDSGNAAQRRVANRRVGAAVNFITALPYVMAMTGHIPASTPAQ